MQTRSLPALVLVAVLATACSGSAGDTGRDPGPASPTVPAAARDAVADLSAALGIDAADLESVEVEEVTWDDGSLGCAEQGGVYTQATVEGHRITIVVDATTYEYHDGGDEAAFRCRHPTE